MSNGEFDIYGCDLKQNVIKSAEEVAPIKRKYSFSDFDLCILCVPTHKVSTLTNPNLTMPIENLRIHSRTII
jgi:hypothetical protein